MPELATVLTFVAASAVLILIPGPNLVYIATQSMSQGPRSGLAAAVGVETGTLVYVLATALGVSGLVARSDLAFTAFTYAGAGYLLHLAARALRNPPTTVSLRDGHHPHTPWRAWRDGAIVNLLNPKVGLFFLAFLPQFLDTAPSAPPAAAQLAALGLIFLGLALVLDVTCALAGAAVAALVAGKGQTETWLRWPVAGIYITLAAWAVLA